MGGLGAGPDLAADAAAQQRQNEAQHQPGRQRQRQRGGDVRPGRLERDFGHGHLTGVGLDLVALGFQLVQPLDHGLIARAHQIDAALHPAQLHFVAGAGGKLIFDLGQVLFQPGAFGRVALPAPVHHR